MKIIIGFSKKDGLLSWLIRKAEGTPYSHVYVRYYNPYIQETIVFHASRTMIHCTTFDLFLKKKNKVVVEYELTTDAEKLRQVIKFSNRQSGKSYGMLQLLGMGIVRVSKLLVKKSFRNPFGDKEKTMVCSEFVAHILTVLGYTIDMARVEIDGPKWIEQQLA